MNITDALSSGNIFTSIEEITRDNTRKHYSDLQSQATPSGDTVDISDEARRLYSEMIHKYDKPQSGAPAGASQPNALQGSEGAAGEAGGQGGGAAAGGGSDSSSSADQVEQIKKQIQALKSQLMSLASQATKDGMGSAAMGKMNSLQAQIAALEAQLNAMEAAG